MHRGTKDQITVNIVSDLIKEKFISFTEQPQSENRTSTVADVPPENNTELTSITIPQHPTNPTLTAPQHQTDPNLTAPQHQTDLSGTPSAVTHNRSSYENIPDCPKPLSVRHSHIPIVECPAYRTIKSINGDYDDIRSTAVIMQPNPSYRHDMFGRRNKLFVCYKK